MAKTCTHVIQKEPVAAGAIKDDYIQYMTFMQDRRSLILGSTGGFSFMTALNLNEWQQSFNFMASTVQKGETFTSFVGFAPNYHLVGTHFGSVLFIDLVANFAARLWQLPPTGSGAEDPNFPAEHLETNGEVIFVATGATVRYFDYRISTPIGSALRLFPHGITSLRLLRQNPFHYMVSSGSLINIFDLRKTNTVTETTSLDVIAINHRIACCTILQETKVAEAAAFGTVDGFIGFVRLGCSPVLEYTEKISSKPVTAIAESPNFTIACGTEDRIVGTKIPCHQNKHASTTGLTTSARHDDDSKDPSTSKSHQSDLVTRTLPKGTVSCFSTRGIHRWDDTDFPFGIGFYDNQPLQSSSSSVKNGIAPVGPATFSSRCLIWH